VNRRSYTTLLACLLICTDASRAAAPGGYVPAVAFAGLWKAFRWFGPQARGPLVIRRQAGRWSADFIGRTIGVHYEAPWLFFSLPDDEGSFQGRLEPDGDRIDGHWTSSHSVLQGFQFAVPVFLKAQGADRWQGAVDPYEDRSTLYLVVRAKKDGSVGAYLRNPERNFGTQYDIDRIVRNGDDVALIGELNGAGPERVLERGRYHAETGTLSIFFPGRGGTYDFQRDDDPMSAFYPRGRDPERYVYSPPLEIDDGWTTGTLDEVGIDRRAIERFIQHIIDMPMESVHTPQVDAVLVARHGTLVLEEYFHGSNRYTMHDTRSASKSITATIAGAAMEAGVPLKLSSRVYDVMYGGKIPDNLDPRKQAMTLEDLLMMRSGYFCDDSNPAAPGNEETMLDQTAEPDYYRYVLKVPMAFDPDTRSVYCSTNPNLALGMVGRATGENPMFTFDRLVGKPLGITRYAWPLDGVGHPYGGGSVQILPRDFLKIGQLMLDGGVWNGHPILSADFVAHASGPLHDLNRIQYGYLWWSIEFPYKNRTVRAFFAGGNGGQAVMVVPELDLVIGIFASNYADRIGLHVQQDFPANYIIPAVRERGDNPTSPIIEGTFKTPYGHPTPQP
jgi:CubicO group peptidase (beta-lactamase class C family)